MPVTIVALAKYPDVFEPFRQNIEQFTSPGIRKIVVLDGDLITEAPGWEIIQAPVPFVITHNWNMAFAAVTPDSDILALNDDVFLLQAGSVEALQELAYSDPAVGMIAARVSIGYVGNPIQMKPRRDRPLTDVKAVGNGSTYFKRSLINSIGLFDEETFSGPYSAEDADYCVRAWQAGFRVCVARDVCVRHGIDEQGCSTSIRRALPSYTKACLEGVQAFKRKWKHFDVWGEKL